jgi:NAD+ synthase
MIKDYKGTADYITKWIREYAKKAGVSTLVLGLSGGIDSALVALLAKRTGLPLVCVNMPCHSSSSAYDRAKAFADENQLQLLKVDLSAAHAVIADQLTTQASFDWQSKGSAGGLRSCLRAPTLSYVAHATNGLILGTGNRSEDRITRYFQKFGDGCVDFCPIADLWKSEVNALFAFLAAEAHGGKIGKASQAILDAKPTADLWGADSGQEDEKELGISYDEIEWADREDVATAHNSEGVWDEDRPGIIFSSEEPRFNLRWASYTPREKDVISTLHRMEKISRHKANPNLPVCDVHNPALNLCE